MYRDLSQDKKFVFIRQTRLKRRLVTKPKHSQYKFSATEVGSKAKNISCVPADEMPPEQTKNNNLAFNSLAKLVTKNHKGNLGLIVASWSLNQFLILCHIASDPQAEIWISWMIAECFAYTLAQRQRFLSAIFNLSKGLLRILNPEKKYQTGMAAFPVMRGRAN